jgi:hypothetical protein
LKFFIKNFLVSKNENLAIVYENFLKKALTHPKRIIHICSNSECFSRQKIQLLANCFLNENEHNNDTTNILKQSTFKYLCVGSVKAFDKNIESQNVMCYFKNREEYFRFASNQRQIISDKLNEINIRGLTHFSIVFDLLNTSHVNDINKFNRVDMNEIEMNNDLKEFEQSSFILYCCARINTILEKFENMVKEGIYKQEFKSIDDLDFQALLKHDLEKKLCQDYLFKYEDYLVEIQKAICANDSKTSIKLDKVNHNKLLKMLVDMSNLFSKYYSKIHVLEVSIIFNVK